MTCQAKGHERREMLSWPLSLEVGVENGLRPTLCRSSESRLREPPSGFFVAKLAEMWYSESVGFAAGS
jgi:hypothetical protein